MSKKQIQAILSGKSETTKQQGFGIGLRYVIKKINEWQGSCAIDSKANQGTSFQISIPTAQTTPLWWTNQIRIPANATVISFKAPATSHKHFNALNILTTNHKKELQASLKKYGQKIIFLQARNKADINDFFQFFRGTRKDINIIIITNNYHRESMQTLCLAKKAKLLPEPLLDHILITTF